MNNIQNQNAGKCKPGKNGYLPGAIKRKAAGIIAAVFCLLFVSCGQAAGVPAAQNGNTVAEEEITIIKDKDTVTGEFFAMDTMMTVTASGEEAEEAVRAAAAEVRRLDALLSIGNEESEVCLLNKNGEAAVSEDTVVLLEKAAEICRLSGGAFDVTVLPLMQYWDFTGKDPHVPSKTEIADGLSLLDPDGIHINKERNAVSFERPGTRIDLGGIAKGYASGRIAEIFSCREITGGMINLGGNVEVFRTKPDGSPYRIGIRDPENRSEIFGVLSAADTAVVTSGGYERYFEEDGKRYHHILDPKTGYPADAGLLSATVVSADGTLADAMATAIFVRGAEAAEEMRKASEEPFSYILITKERKVILSDALEDSFETELPVTVIAG